MMLDALGYLITAAMAATLGIYFRPSGKKPWPHDYLQFRQVEATRILPDDPLGVAYISARARLIKIATGQIPQEEQQTIWHEEAHIALGDLFQETSTAVDAETEEAMADVVAYSRTLAAGEKLFETHSNSEHQEPGSVLLTLDQVFECMRLAQHLHDSTRSK